jgi:hypothetical protein
MDKMAKILVPLLAILLGASSAQAQSALPPGGIVDPRLVGPTDRSYAPRFFIGALVFRIPNEFLIFPWPTGQHRFDRSICSAPNAVKDPTSIAACKAESQSVFMKIPIPGFASDGKINGDLSHVTLGFHDLAGSSPSYS